MRLSWVVAGVVILILVGWTVFEGLANKGVTGKKLLIRGGCVLFMIAYVLVDYGLLGFGG